MSNDSLKNKIPEIIEMDYQGKTVISNVIDFIQKYIMPLMDGNVKVPFNKKVACYYGCLLVRPQKLTNADRFEDPQSMETIMKSLGAEPISWGYKTECCGAGLSVSRTHIVEKLSAKIIEDAVSRGAEAIIVACPMCQSNLDMRRKGIDNYLKKATNIPVLFITQAIGMALGLEDNKLGIQRHIVPVNLDFSAKPPLVNKVNKSKEAVNV